MANNSASNLTLDPNTGGMSKPVPPDFPEFPESVLTRFPELKEWTERFKKWMKIALQTR